MQWILCVSILYDQPAGNIFDQNNFIVFDEAQALLYFYCLLDHNIIFVYYVLWSSHLSLYCRLIRLTSPNLNYIIGFGVVVFSSSVYMFVYPPLPSNVLVYHCSVS